MPAIIRDQTVRSQTGSQNPSELSHLDQSIDVAGCARTCREDPPRSAHPKIACASADCCDRFAGSRLSSRDRVPGIGLRVERPGQLHVDLLPFTGPPIIHMTLPWPWSVPPLPFSCTVRPGLGEDHNDGIVPGRNRGRAQSLRVHRRAACKRPASWPPRGALIDMGVPSAKPHKRKPDSRLCARSTGPVAKGIAGKADGRQRTRCPRSSYPSRISPNKLLSRPASPARKSSAQGIVSGLQPGEGLLRSPGRSSAIERPAARPAGDIRDRKLARQNPRQNRTQVDRFGRHCDCQGAAPKITGSSNRPAC